MLIKNPPIRTLIKIAKKVKTSLLPSPVTLTETRLINLTNECLAYIKKYHVKTELKILWPTVFNHDQTWWAHDGILINALRLRGAAIIPTMCDKLQADQCMGYSGVWQAQPGPDFAKARASLCEGCVQRDLKLWSILQIHPIRLSSYLSEAERTQIWQEVESIITTDWQHYESNGYPVGKEAYKAVVNNQLQADITPEWTDLANDMAKHHLFNILALNLAYQRVLTNFEPDRVVGNGGHYYQWGVLNHLCQQKKIPYYRYYAIGLQPQSWNYALNSIALVDISGAWKSWCETPWLDDKNQKVIKDLRVRGLELEDKNIQNTKAQAIAAQLGIHLDKPILLLLTGVIWDAATNLPGRCFKDMYAWLFATIEWARLFPHYQIIIRVHPAEDIVVGLAESERSRFLKELNQRKIQLPPNIILINSKEKIETYDLMYLANVACVYTSTTGLEFACSGKPLITIGHVHYSNKGFTIDPNSNEEYFSTLNQLLSSKLSTDEQLIKQNLAMRYWYLYAFHGSTVMGFYEKQKVNWLAIKRGIDGFALVPKVITVEDLLPGKNAQLDYFCDSVINGQAFMGENRWPPEVAEEHRQP